MDVENEIRRLAKGREAQHRKALQRFLWRVAEAVLLYDDYELQEATEYLDEKANISIQDTSDLGIVLSRVVFWAGLPL